MSDEIKVWRCGGGHVLGQVVRNGSGLQQLLLYRYAITHHQSSGDPMEIDVIAIIEGYAASIRCSICGRMRLWVPGEEALRKMLRNRGR